MTTPQTDDRPANLDLLDSALAHLVDAGELTGTQAQHVHESYADELAHAPSLQPSAPATGGPPERARWTARLAEVGAYLGAALVAAAGAIAVGQQWRELGRTGQFALLAGLTVAFAVAGAAVVLVRRQRSVAEPQEAVLRRLASTLLTLAAGAAVGLVARAFVPDRGEIPESRVGWMLVTMALVAGLVLVVTRLVAPSALAETGLYACVLVGATGVWAVFGPADSPSLAMAGLFAIGVLWAAAAFLTRMLTVPTLGAVLGLGTAVVTTLGDVGQHTSQILAATLAIGGFAAYLALPRWPLVAAAMLAAVVLTFSVVGDAYGVAMALLVAGLVLLGLAATAFFLRRRPPKAE